MQRVTKQYYYGKNGERKINGYKIYISKETLSKANITENDKLNVCVEGNKIIIEKEK